MCVCSLRRFDRVNSTHRLPVFANNCIVNYHCPCWKFIGFANALHIWWYFFTQQRKSPCYISKVCATGESSRTTPTTMRRSSVNIIPLPSIGKEHTRLELILLNTAHFLLLEIPWMVHYYVNRMHVKQCRYFFVGFPFTHVIHYDSYLNVHKAPLMCKYVLCETNHWTSTTCFTCAYCTNGWVSFGWKCV